jgi:hypothetical protein
MLLFGARFTKGAPALHVRPPALGPSGAAAAGALGAAGLGASPLGAAGGSGAGLLALLQPIKNRISTRHDIDIGSAPSAQAIKNER